MNQECSPLTRSLYAWEIQEARRVFGERLNYPPIRIHECATWPDAMNRLGSWLKGMPPPQTHNAVTLGNHLYFPVRLLAAPVPVDDPQHGLVSWLIHELTHAWQYQQLGWRYLYLALEAQLRQGAGAYDYGGEAGLLECSAQGGCLDSFNLEQQGDIARYYYERLCTGQDVSAWTPFVAEFQGPDRPQVA